MPLDRAVPEAAVREWRERVNIAVVRDAGFAYESYTRLKLASVREFIADLLVDLRDVPLKSPFARAIAAVVDAWAESRSLVYNPDESEALSMQVTGAPLPRWVELLLNFDIKYRERRLHFMIEGQNRLYGMLDQEAFRTLSPQVVDRLKRRLYAKLDDVCSLRTTPTFGPAVRELAQRIFSGPPSAGQVKKLTEHAAEFVKLHGEDIDRLVDLLAAQIGLNSTTRDLDGMLASLDPAEWPREARREIMVNYLGFPFWDVLTFPLMSSHESGEFNQILVDRISPTDAHALKGFGGSTSLKGVGFGHFAAFLSRGYRENDYLLGRLHALERLIDIVCDSAGVEPGGRVDIVKLKKRGFQRILAAEAKHLKASRHLVDALQRCIDEM
jgi:hypothetical protein